MGSSSTSKKTVRFADMPEQVPTAPTPEPCSCCIAEQKAREANRYHDCGKCKEEHDKKEKEKKEKEDKERKEFEHWKWAKEHKCYCSACVHGSKGAPHQPAPAPLPVFPVQAPPVSPYTMHGALPQRVVQRPSYQYPPAGQHYHVHGPTGIVTPVPPHLAPRPTHSLNPVTGLLTPIGAQGRPVTTLRDLTVSPAEYAEVVVHPTPAPARPTVLPPKRKGICSFTIPLGKAKPVKLFKAEDAWYAFEVGKDKMEKYARWDGREWHML